MKLTAIAVLLTLIMSAKAEPSHHEVVASVLWAEARGEGFDGIHAVAEVIRNRAKGGSHFEVVTKPKQFSCLNETTPAKLVQKAKMSFARDQVAWRYSLAVAKQLERGTHYSNLTKGATHYCRSYAYWQKKMEFCATIGRHTFYR